MAEYHPKESASSSPEMDLLEKAISETPISNLSRLSILVPQPTPTRTEVTLPTEQTQPDKIENPLSSPRHKTPKQTVPPLKARRETVLGTKSIQSFPEVRISFNDF